MGETVRTQRPLSLTPPDPLAVEAGVSFLRQSGVSAEQDAPSRGILGQIAVGAVRGPVMGLANIPRALSAIPALRPAFEPIAEGLESLVPEPSGGAVESGVESATAFLTELLLFRGGAGIIGRFAPRIGAALTSRTGLSSQIIGTFAGAEFAQSRQELEQINQRLPEGQRIPTDEITRSSLISAVAEAGPEILSTPFVVGNLLRLGAGPVGQAAVATLRGMFQNPQSGLARAAAKVASVAAPVAEIAATEAPTEALTAGLQAGERRRVLAGTGIETPGALEAIRQSIPSTLVSSALIAGAGRLGRRLQPSAPPPPVTEQPLEVPAGAPPPEPQLPTAPLSPEQQRFAQTLLPGLAPRLAPQEIRRTIEPDIPSTVDAGLRRRGLPGLPPPPRQELTGIPILGQGLIPLPQPQETPASGIAEVARATPPGILPSALEAGLQRRGLASPVEAPGLESFRASARNLVQALGATVPESLPQLQSFVADLPLPVRRAAAEDAALEYVVAQQQQDFADFNFAAAREALQRLYNLPTEAEATRILTAAVGAAQEPATPPAQAPGTAPTAPAPTAPPEPAGVVATPAAQTPGAPVAEPPLSPGEQQPVPAFVQDVMTQLRQQAERLGLTADIQRLNAEGLTAAQVVDRIGPARFGSTELIDRTSMVRAIRRTGAAPSPPAPPPSLAARPGRPSAPVAAPPTPATAEQRQQAVTQAAAAPAPAVQGRVETVRTEAGTDIDTRFAIVEAQDLIPSHDLALNVNPAFPQDLQPRDRSRVSSETQINSILQRLDPERLAESRVAGMGAPIVGPDLVVESGNARTLALLQGYQQQHATMASYQQFLRDNAERFGISQEQLASLQQPVLVRIRRTALTPEQRIAFTREANIPSTQQMSAVERAQTDAALLTPAMLAVFNPSEDGTIAAASNREFVGQFVQALPETERSEMRTREGQLSQAGVNRIRNALFYRVYGNIPALERLAEDTDSNIKNITNALVLASRDFSRVQRGIAEGSLHPINPVPDLMAAVTKFSALRDQGETVDNYLQQGGLFGEELSPLATDMLRFVAANTRSARRVAEVLQRMGAAIEAVGDPRQATFPGITRDIPTAAEVFVAALHAVEETHGRQLALASPTLPEPGAPGGHQAPGGAAQRAAGPTPAESEARPTGPPQAGDTSGADVGGSLDAGPAQIEEPAARFPAFFPAGTTPGGERADASDATRQAGNAALGTLVLTEAGDNANAPASVGRGVLPAPRGRIRVTQKGRGVLELTRTIPENEVIEDLRTTGQAAYVGRTIRGREDMAVAGQSLRDPRMEHFSVVGVDADGLGILYEGVSSRLPASAQPFLLTATERRRLRRHDRAIQRAEQAGQVRIAEGLHEQRNAIYLQIQDRAIRDLGQRLQAAGATSYYLLHNHPSTNLAVSPGDVNVTTRIAAGIPGFQGHIVLDSGAYSFISPDLRLQENIPLPAEVTQPVDPFHVPANPNVLSAEPIRGTDDIVRLGLAVNRQDAVVAFFLTTQPGERNAWTVRGALLIPTNVWNKAGITAYLRKRQAEYGGRQVITFSNSPSSAVHDVARRLFEDGVLAEHVAVFSGIRSDATVSLLQEAGDIRPRRTPGVPLGVAVREEPRQYQVFKNIPTTLEGVRVEHVNKAVLDYAMMANMAETSGIGDRLSDAAFRKLKITFPQLDAIGSKTLLRWLTDTDPDTGASLQPGQFQRFVRAVRSGEVNPSSSAMSALAKLEQAMLHDLNLKLVQGEITEEQFREAEGQIVQFSLTIPGTSDSARVLRMSQKPFITPGVVRFQDFITRLQKITGRDMTAAEVEDAMRRWREALQTGDRRSILALMEQTENPTLSDLYWELYYGSLLSGIPTHTVNTLGTLMNLTFHDTVVEGTAAVLDAAIAGITGRQRTKHFAAVVNGFRASWGHWREAYRDAFVWWKSPLPRAIGGEGSLAQPSALLSRGGRRTVDAQRLRLDVGAEAWARATADTMPAALPQASREQLAAFIRAAAPFVGAATRGMAAMDVAAKTMAFDGAVARLATEDAIRHGLPAEQHQAFIQHVRSNILQFPEIEAEAQRVEEDRTFNDAPGKLGQTIIGLRSIPGLGIFFRLLLPFASTPDRLLARGLELVPLVGVPIGLQERGFGWQGFLPGFQALKAGDARALEIAAKQIVGTFLTAMVFALWDDDKITGPLSKNPSERDSQLRRGLIPHAVLLGEHAYEYRRFEPLALPMGAVTSAFEAMRQVQQRRTREGLDTSRPALLEEPLAVASVAVNNTLRFVFDSSYFSGLARFFESLSPSGGGVVQGLSGQLIAAVVPFVSLLRQSSRVLETTGLLEGTTAGDVQVRERETIGQNILAGLPGLSAGVRPRLEVSGEPRALPLTPLEALVSPVRRARLTQDPVEQALARLDYFPGQPTEGALRQAIKRQPTDDELFAYRQLRGQLAFQELERIVEAPFFQRLDDEDQRTRIKRAFARATKRARKELFGRARAVLPGVED